MKSVADELRTGLPLSSVYEAHILQPENKGMHKAMEQKNKIRDIFDEAPHYFTSKQMLTIETTKVDK